MIVIKVELWARDPKIFGKVNVTQLAEMHISNDGTGTDNKMNYNGAVMRKPWFTKKTRIGRVENYPRHDKVIWVLIARMLKSMGYQ